MTTADDWKTQAKQLIRAEMKRRSLSYADLATRMHGIGLPVNERTLANKIAQAVSPLPFSCNVWGQSAPRFSIWTVNNQDF
jgi:hypothetical protein